MLSSINYILLILIFSYSELVGQVQKIGQLQKFKISSNQADVKFDFFTPFGNAQAVLILIPGYNGEGENMLDARWIDFAIKFKIALLAPTFQANKLENNKSSGYFYPEQGSGEIIENALKELNQRLGVHTNKVLFFGFSAGAHFCHRFALWKPERVKAFVAYSAGWWSEPDSDMKKIPALIMCGEDDERYEATFNFFKKGQKLDCPWIWRSYPNTGHILTSEVRDMAEAFLADQMVSVESEKKVRRYGDIQTFKSVPEEEKETIPEECRICLPSAKVADVWEKETSEPNDQ